MPDIENYTPFPNFRYYSSDSGGRDFGVVIVKATYDFAPSGRLLIGREQAPMAFTDLCHGSVNVSSLKYPSDLVPNKPATDIIVNAVARAPKGKAAPSWPCGIGIDDSVGNIRALQALRVTGPRQWVPKWKRMLSDEEKREWQKHRADFDKWKLSAPEPIAELPLHYEYAYGGVKPKGYQPDGTVLFDHDPHNPLGLGAIDVDWTDHTKPVPAPQIERQGEPITEAYKAYRPEGLGPIPPAWDPRLPLGGTYDENWRKNVWPNWPDDYSFAYHNSAHPSLICKGHLSGDERVALLNLLQDTSAFAFDLPGDRIALSFVKPDGSEHDQEMVLDTVLIDIASDSRRRRRVYLSWRANFPPDVYETVRIDLKRRERTAQDVRTLIRQRINERTAS